MSEIRTYLEEKAQTPNEWLRREPRTTHPAILAAVRECPDTNNDATERFIEKRVGDLPEHRHHGHEKRDALTNQLGHEVYLARCLMHDEEAAAREAEAVAEGFAPLESVELVDGVRYEVRLGTRYSGQSVPNYAGAVQVRAKIHQGYIVFFPKGARSRYFVPSNPSLVRAI
jgi:hypothetical protein